jgi:hypothetical protein
MTKAQLRYGLRRARLVFESDSLIFFVAYLVIVSGIPIMIDPSIFAPVSVQSALSEWLIRLWGADLLVGGLLSGYGLLGERPRIEAGGFSFVSRWLFDLRFCGCRLLWIRWVTSLSYLCFVYGGCHSPVP